MRFFLFFLSTFFLLNSCGDGFNKLGGGLSYKILKKGNTDSIIDPDSYYYAQLLVMDKSGNKVLCDGIDPDFYMISTIKDKKYAFDISTLFALLHKGDSLLIKSPADSFFMFYYGIPTPGCVQDNEILISMYIQDVMSAEAYESKIMQSRKDIIQQKIEEFDAYLRVNKIEEAPTGFGIVKQQHKKGNGKAAVFGNEVRLHFEQRIMNGELIQSTYETNEPIIYIIGGEGGIQALDFGLNGMQVGEISTIYSPYFLAFGDQGLAPHIPPFSNMIFKVELLAIQE